MTSRAGAAWRASAVLLDLDGVLLDTTATARAAWRWWAGRVGADAEEVVQHARGRRPIDVVTRFAPDRATAVEVAALEERSLTLVGGTRRVPGAVGFVRALPPGRWAVVSSASAAVTARHLRRARVTPPATVVTGDATATGRPDPAPHLAARAGLRGSAGPVLAIESSSVGVVAARAAGCTVLGVAPMGDTTALPGADAYVHGVGVLRVRLVADGLLVTVGHDLPRQG